MAYQNMIGAGIGNLLRMIKEEQSKSPIVSPSAETGSPARSNVQGPVMGAESPGSERIVSLQPEDVTAPVSAEAQTQTAPTRVGPLAIGGEDVGAITPPQPSIPGKGDINPETGKAYAVNPESGVWDDNYYANIVEKKLLTGWRPGTIEQGGTGPFNQPGPSIPSKSDINPDTGKPYGVNPETGVWDDNYYATLVEPQLKAGTFGKQPEAPQVMQQPQPQVLGTQITGAVTQPSERWIAPQTETTVPIGTQIGGTMYGPTEAEIIAANNASADAQHNKEMQLMNEISKVNPEENMDEYLRRVNAYERGVPIPGKPTPTLYPTPTPMPTRR